MLTKMERKGVVAHRSEGRRFVYHATVTEAEINLPFIYSSPDGKTLFVNVQYPGTTLAITGPFPA